MNGIVSTFLAVLTSLSLAVPALAQEGMNTRQSGGSVAETVERLEAAIKQRGAKIVAVIDHQSNAASVDTDIPAATVVIFGNPALGTPLIAENPIAGLDLPQRMLVWDDAGTTRIGYREPTELAKTYGINPALKAVQTMTGALDGLAAEAALKTN